MNGNALSEPELARLYKMKGEGYTTQQIADALGRKYNTILHRITWDAMSSEERDEYRAYQRGRSAKRRAEPEASELSPHRPTAEMILDRDIRCALPSRDLTGFLMGDPPAGLSALEGRR